jgi:hypothetical protein
MNFAAGGIEGELVLRGVLSVEDCRGGCGGDEKEGVAKEVSRRGEAGRGAGGTTMEGVEHGGLSGVGKRGGGGQAGLRLENSRGHELPRYV